MDYQDQEHKAVHDLKKVIPPELRGNLVAASKGFFAEVFESTACPNHYVVSSVDTAGTKMIIAEALQTFDTIGIDIVAMNTNDIATLGKAAPFLFMNAISCQNEFQQKGYVAELMKGITKGLTLSDCSNILSIPVQLGKGETASVHELISGIRPGMGVDVAGSMIGFISKQDFDLTVPNGVILALASSGPHSNGFTTLRHALLDGAFEKRTNYKNLYKGRYSLTDNFAGVPLGDWLLTPTTIYAPCVAEMAKAFKVVGINNTGYGLKNFNRLPGRFTITKPTPPPPQFALVQKATGYDTAAMYTTFNMGMGFFILCSKQDAVQAQTIATNHGIRSQVIGTVAPALQASTTMVYDGKEHSFTGY